MEQIVFPIPEICEYITPETKKKVYLEVRFLFLMIYFYWIDLYNNYVKEEGGGGIKDNNPKDF